MIDLNTASDEKCTGIIYDTMLLIAKMELDFRYKNRTYTHKRSHKLCKCDSTKKKKAIQMDQLNWWHFIWDCQVFYRKVETVFGFGIVQNEYGMIAQHRGTNDKRCGNGISLPLSPFLYFFLSLPSLMTLNGDKTRSQNHIKASKAKLIFGQWQVYWNQQTSLYLGLIVWNECPLQWHSFQNSRDTKKSKIIIFFRFQDKKTSNMYTLSMYVSHI